jgi:GNAT superfamily N-acetyltransferase
MVTRERLSRTYSFVRSRQLEGTFPGSNMTGVWEVTAARILKGWGAPTEDAWPYDAATWPPTEPEGIDELAKAFRIFAYGRARTVDECRYLLAKETMINAAFEIDASWQTSQTGIIEDPVLHEPNATHHVTLVGYHDDRQQFIFANSWGTSWGDKGYGYLPYSYMTERLLEAWYYDNDRPAAPRSAAEGVMVRTHGVIDPFEQLRHMVEVEDRTRDETLAWAFALETPAGIEVEELFVRPAYRRQGHGRELAREIRSVAEARQLRVMCWIPHADWATPLSPAQGAIFARLRVAAKPSSELWASGIAIEES